jgi:hypothetical protein
MIKWNIAAIFPVTIEAVPKAIPINDNITVIVHAHPSRVWHRSRKGESASLEEILFIDDDLDITLTFRGGYRKQE